MIQVLCFVWFALNSSQRERGLRKEAEMKDPPPYFHGLVLTLGGPRTELAVLPGN